MLAPGMIGLLMSVKLIDFIMSRSRTRENSHIYSFCFLFLKGFELDEGHDSDSGEPHL